MGERKLHDVLERPGVRMTFPMTTPLCMQQSQPWRNFGWNITPEVEKSQLHKVLAPMSVTGHAAQDVFSVQSIYSVIAARTQASDFMSALFAVILLRKSLIYWHTFVDTKDGPRNHKGNNAQANQSRSKPLLLHHHQSPSLPSLHPHPQFSLHPLLLLVAQLW